MFTCKSCLDKQAKDPEFLWLIAPHSHGPCEWCREVNDCVDVPSSTHHIWKPKNETAS